MNLRRYTLVLAISISSVCRAQQWELGAVGGYGWYFNPSIAHSTDTAVAQAGYPPRSAIGVVLGDNMYTYVGGEIRYLFRFGGPELQSGPIRASMSGSTNLVTYDLMIHMRPRDSIFRPFVAGGAGIKVYTGTGFRSPSQPLAEFALLTPVTQVEPTISVGGGLKYLFLKHAQLRVDFRTYMTPLPNEIFRPTGLSAIRGWVFDFVPTAGISYVF
jgi:hypothetical protein